MLQIALSPEPLHPQSRRLESCNPNTRKLALRSSCDRLQNAPRCIRKSLNVSYTHWLKLQRDGAVTARENERSGANVSTVHRADSSAKLLADQCGTNLRRHAVIHGNVQSSSELKPLFSLETWIHHSRQCRAEQALGLGCPGSGSPS